MTTLQRDDQDQYKIYVAVKDTGMNDFLGKPIEFEALTQTLEKWLKPDS